MVLSSSSSPSSKSNSSARGGFSLKRGFNEAFNTAKSALSSVASFITECHSSGIPFTVADKAMIESQETYKKYWEGGLHSKNNDNMKNNDNSNRKAVVVVGGEGSSMTIINENNNSSSSSSINPKTALELKEYFDNKKKQQQQQQAEANAIEEEERHRHHHHKRRKLNPNTMTTTTATEATTTTQIINNNEDNQNNNQKQKHKNLSFLEQTLVSIQEMLNEKRLINEENEIHTFAIKSPRQFIVSTVRSQLIDTLLTNHGNVNDPSFKASLDILASMYKSSQINACSSRQNIKRFLQGNWVVISRPNFKECLGTSPGGDFMYTLGRMSFDMFRPSHLKCSVQSTHNTFSLIKSNTSNNKKKKKSNDNNEEKKNNDENDNDSDDDSDDDNDNNNDTNNNNNELPSFIPSSLKNEIQKSNSDSLLLCKYDIATSLTIEPDDDEDDDDDENDDDDNKPSAKGGGTTTNRQRRRRRRRRQRALMLVKGYMLPDPNKTNRFTVWFTSGRLAPAVLSSSDNNNNNNSNDDDNYGNLDTWKELFSNSSNSSENHQNQNHQNQQPTIIKTRTATWSEQARGMAARLLLGADLPNGMNMNDNYALSYTLHRPIGGHGQTYVDVLYLDRDILITKGNRGTIYVMATSAVSQRYCEIENV